MNCHTELTSPTAVSHSISLPFLHPKANNLVVAKTSLLQIFEFKSVVVTETESDAVENGDTSPQDLAADTVDRTFTTDITLQRLEHATKLALIAEFPLPGTVSSLGRVKLASTQSGGHALLIAFREAKLAMIEWDPERATISTISIHYFENSLASTPWAPPLNQCPSYVTVDPGNRCSVLRFGPRHVAIVPYRQQDDDLAGEDFDSDLDDPADRPAVDKNITNGESLTSKTPYGPSFVVPLTQMDLEIIFPIHLAFLYEYREPTFGILYSTKAPSMSMTLERKDLLSYKVFTLDLEQQASTTIVSVSQLPTGLHKIIPLALPVGGALILGNNDVVHIDQAGKSTAIAVNEFSKATSSFPMIDQSSLELKLEGCAVESIGENGDILLILVSGELVILSFKLDGRSVAGLSMHKISTTQGGRLGPAGISCSSNLGRGKFFLGSEDSDSVVLGWSRKTTQLSRKRSHVDFLSDSEVSFDEDDIEDDDDIYGGESQLTKVASRTSAAGPIEPDAVMFRLHDKLPNLAPTGDVCFGKLNDDKKLGSSKRSHALQLVYPNGRGPSGGIAISRQALAPMVMGELSLEAAQAVWAFHAVPPAPKGLIPKGEQDSEGMSSAEATFDKHLIASSDSEAGGDSFLYDITSSGVQKTQRGEFRTEGATIDVGTLSNGTRIVHVKSSEVLCYNSDFGLEQILPMLDENTDEELKVVAVSFCDPYLLILRDDSSATIFEINDAGELEELDRGDGILASEWLSGCLYCPTGNDAKTMAFLMTSQGSLRVFVLPDLETPAYSTDAFPYLPSHITNDFVPRRYANRETLAEIAVADLGDTISKSPYIILRTNFDDIVMYQPYHFPVPPRNSTLLTNVRWKKVIQPKLSTASDIISREPTIAGRGTTLRHLPNVGGYSTVFHNGSSPAFILKESSSMPKLVKLEGNAISSLVPLHTGDCERGFISIDVLGTTKSCKLLPRTRYGDTGWPTRQVSLGQEVTHIAYHESKEFYVVATCTKQEFKLPEDDNHKEWATEDAKLLPLANRTSIKILDPKSWSIINSLEFDDSELCLSMIAADLEVSEKTHERRSFIAVGTVLATGEDQAARGRVHILDIIDVVPEPDKPETGFRLKTWAKEEVRGAVTALTEIGPQGFLLVAQGQKCLVRGLIEERKLLPVAFMDVQTYVTTTRVLRGTGLFMIGDIMKGLWFGGYAEDPYKMSLFGKSASHMEVVASEFLPQDKQLNILVADSDKNIHVLQYDPESAKSQSGRRLLHRSTFHTGHYALSMHLLPSTMSPPDNRDSPAPELNGHDDATPPTPHQVLVVTQTGVIALITPIDELMYLRLNAMQTYLTGQLEHACGLNPRGYRAVESERMGIKGIVDGTILMRWAELAKQRRVEAAGRIGAGEVLLRGDLDMISGGGLGYL